MTRKKRKNGGSVQGHALLYGRSSRPILIVNGKKVEAVEKQKSSSKRKCRAKKKVRKKHRISDDIIQKLEKLPDPLDMMGKYARAQKYEAAKSSEKYEYGLSDW